MSPGSEKERPRVHNAQMEPLPLSPSHRQLRAESRASGPAGSKKAQVAADTLSFFEVDGDRKICKFCM